MPLLKKVLYILSFLGLFYVLQKASAIASPEGSHLFTDFLSAQNYEMGEGCTEKAARFAPTFEKYKTTFFERSFLRNPHAVRKALADEKASGEALVEHLSFTVDEVPVAATFFNRQSTTLVVLVGGFAVPREALTGASKLLEGYDLLLCDFPGHGPDRRPAKTRVGKITETIGSWLSAGFNRDDMTYSERETACIDTAMKLVEKRKTYKKIVGAGFCYGGYFLLKLHEQRQAAHERSFDSFWLDGLWLSIASVANHYLYFQFVRLSDSQVTKLLTDNWFAQYLSTSCTRTVVGKDLSAFPPVTAYFKSIGDVEVVLVKARRDILVPDPDFEIMRDQLKKDKVSAFVWDGPAYHARMHINYPTLYAHFVHAFIDGGLVAFKEELKEMAAK